MKLEEVDEESSQLMENPKKEDGRWKIEDG